jgi:lipopolysaccharide/colanic/teichoic acid biosynthesis glycosyltransferase
MNCGIDILFSALGLLVLSPLILLVRLLGWFGTRAPLFFPRRVERNQKLFVLVKLHTMHIDTASVASHLVGVTAITPFGGFFK